MGSWDHLRRRLPFHVPLNKWGREQNIDVFCRAFRDAKHYCAMREGEGSLTAGIKVELSDYRQDELTCGANVILAQKAT
jgi:hypothetical protein